MKKRILSLLLATALVLGLGGSALALTSLPSENRYDGDYSWNWASTVKSHLIPTDEGYLRVEAVRDADWNLQVVAETYSRDFQLLSQKYLPAELPIWGGFYAGTDCYFAVYGQNNPEHSDEVETYRVVKYDRQLNRLGAAAYRANNTAIPFDGGSLRMAEAGGMLYIRTCHEMYNGHQANVTLAVRESDMTITDEFSIVMNAGVGYVSHSFNQFIAVSGQGRLLALDHGDAYPRSVELFQYGPKAGSERFQGSGLIHTSLLDIPGETGDNYTGVQVGGFALSDTHAVTVGISCVQGDSTEGPRNLFVAAAPLSDISQGHTFLPLTHFSAEDPTAPGNPQLVAVPDGFYALWQENPDGGYYSPRVLKVQKLDGTGTPVGSAYSFSADLSDCPPIYQDGKVIWYTTHDSAPRFFVLDTQDMTLTQTIPGDPMLSSGIVIQTEMPVLLGTGGGYQWGATRYEDVAEKDWFSADLITATQAGLLNGTGGNKFSPRGNVTVAQAITLACRLHAGFHYGTTLTLSKGEPWYQPALDYAGLFGLYCPAGDPNRACTREEFVAILDSAVPQISLPPRHTGTAFQNDVFQSDAYRAAVARFYQAGIVDGLKQDGAITFLPQGNLTRAQAAAILTRLIRPESRV